MRAGRREPRPRPDGRRGLRRSGRDSGAIGGDASQELIDTLGRELKIGSERVYVSNAPLGLSALMELTAIDRPDLKDKPWVARTRRPFVSKSPADLLARIRRRDILVHHPYDSFTPVLRFLEEAAMGLLLAGIGNARIPRLRVDRIGNAGDRHPTRHRGGDLGDSLERVLRLGGAVVAEQDAPPWRRCCPAGPVRSDACRRR